MALSVFTPMYFLIKKYKNQGRTSKSKVYKWCDDIVYLVISINFNSKGENRKHRLLKPWLIIDVWVVLTIVSYQSVW